MPTQESQGRAIETDAEGYVQRWDAWDSNVAATIARDEEVPDLTERHWEVLDFLRSHYRAFGSAPTVEEICKELRLPFRQIYELFPTGPFRGAWKIAGLPRAPRHDLLAFVATRRAQRRSGSGSRRTM